MCCVTQPTILLCNMKPKKRTASIPLYEEHSICRRKGHIVLPSICPVLVVDLRDRRLRRSPTYTASHGAVLQALKIAMLSGVGPNRWRFGGMGRPNGIAKIFGDVPLPGKKKIARAVAVPPKAARDSA